MKTLKERFDNSYTKIPEAGCWIWLNSCDKDGYGYIKENNKTKKAHRISYQLFKGPVPDKVFVCHSCDIPSCVNPDHLWLGSALTNNQDMQKKKRVRHGKHNHFGINNPNYRHGLRVRQRIDVVIRPEIARYVDIGG